MVFDLTQYIKDHADLFGPGDEIELKLVLRNFVPNDPDAEDFKVSYTFALSYYDKQPPISVADLDFSVTASFAKSDLGDASKIG